MIPAAAAFDSRKRLLPEIRCGCVFLAKSGVVSRDPARELIDFGSFLPDIGAHGTHPFDSKGVRIWRHANRFAPLLRAIPE